MEQFPSLEALSTESVAGAGEFEVLARGHGMRSALSDRLALLYIEARALGFAGALGMVLISLLFAGNALAQDTTAPATHDRTSSLSWIRMPGAESCIPTQELARAVEARLARAVFVSASQGDVSIEGRIDRKGAANHWHATIILRDSKGATIGTRDLDRVDASCSAINEQLALVIAVMIDPDAALSHPTPPPASTTTTPAPSPPPAPTPTTTTPNPPPPEKQAPIENTSETKSPSKKADPWFFEASAATFGEVGMTPNPGFGLGVSSLLEAPHVPIALDGSAAIFFDSTADAPGGAATSFTLGLFSGGLCPLRFRKDRVHVFGCLISQLGLLRSESQGYAVSTGNKLGVLYNIGLEARASLRIAGPFALRGGLSWVVPLIRSPYDYDRGTQSVELFQVAPVALTGDLGIGFEFP
jgi:hypothetical protein